MNRVGKEVSLDLKIGVLHAYPNGELQFESQNSEKHDFSDKHLQRRYEKRLASNTDEQVVTEKNLEQLARAMSVGASTAKIKSCFLSIKTPATLKSGNSSALSKFKNEQNSIVKPWYKDMGRSASQTGHYSKKRLLDKSDDLYS